MIASREVDQKRKEEAMERLAEARQFVEIETEKRRKKREAKERADLQFREGDKIQTSLTCEIRSQIRCLYKVTRPWWFWANSLIQGRYDCYIHPE